MAQIIIKSRFNGPPDSGNGGYVCGVVASAIEGPSIVTLRKPPPLERELTLETQDDGQAVLRDGETVVGEAIAEGLDLDLPEPPSSGASTASCFARLGLGSGTSSSGGRSAAKGESSGPEAPSSTKTGTPAR